MNDVRDSHNESFAKSSGFSSFSSLVSSNDQVFVLKTRSTSMPSIHVIDSSSTDSIILTDDSYSDMHETEASLCTDVFHRQQSFTTCFDGELSSYQEDETIHDDFINFKPYDKIEKADIISNRLENEKRFVSNSETFIFGKSETIDM